FPRQNVFAATTNKEDWLVDDTGGRRFWPVKAGQIDIEALRRDRDQIWAEAYAAYRGGEMSWLTDVEESMAKDEQALRQEPDVWDDIIMRWVEVPVGKDRLEINSTSNRANVGEILQHAIGLEPDRWTQRESRRVTRILRLHHYRETRFIFVFNKLIDSSNFFSNLRCLRAEG